MLAEKLYSENSPYRKRKVLKNEIEFYRVAVTNVDGPTILLCYTEISCNIMFCFALLKCMR